MTYRLNQIVFVLCLLSLSSCGKQSPQNSDLQGYPASATTHVGSSYMVETAALDPVDLATYIRTANKGIDKATAATLAKDIKTVAKCFAIDPRLLAAQIQQESSFDTNAESPTGAAGLMQMTGIGIQEVEDQLGRRGTDQAGSKATKYFKGIVAGCATKAFGEDFAMRTMLWKRTKAVSIKKSLIKSEPRVGLVYGAIMLKTLLSKAKTEDSERNMRELYERALSLYNGDPKEQEHYKTVIMQRSNDIK